MPVYGLLEYNGARFDVRQGSVRVIYL